VLQNASKGIRNAKQSNPKGWDGTMSIACHSIGALLKQSKPNGFTKGWPNVYSLSIGWSQWLDKGMAQCLLHFIRLGALLNNSSPMVLPRVGPMSIAFQ
jgi:hypothetical protein